MLKIEFEAGRLLLCGNPDGGSYNNSTCDAGFTFWSVQLTPSTQLKLYELLKVVLEQKGLLPEPPKTEPNALQLGAAVRKLGLTGDCSTIPEIDITIHKGNVGCYTLPNDEELEEASPDD